VSGKVVRSTLVTDRRDRDDRGRGAFVGSTIGAPA
jgi:hypothetical protein